MVPLAFMLALTYSRSGMLILLAEVLLFQLLQPCERRMGWRWVAHAGIHEPEPLLPVWCFPLALQVFLTGLSWRIFGRLVTWAL